ncbi:MAG: Com family DNA-binding transcriptional regulator [Clostridium sp.]
MKEIRCYNCNHMLMKAEIVKGEIKCPRCKKINTVIELKDRA